MDWKITANINQPESDDWMLSFYLLLRVKPCTFVGLGLALPCMLTPNPHSWLLEIKLGGVSRSGPVMILFLSLCSFGHVNFTSLSLSLSRSLSISLTVYWSIHPVWGGIWWFGLLFFCLYSLKYASAVWNLNVDAYTFTHSVIKYPNLLDWY